MNLSENLLTILIEECNETAQRATKALRFGLTEVQPGQEKTNAERLVYEFNDIVAVMELLHQREDVPGTIDREMITLKKDKVIKYTYLSCKEGTITGDWEDPHVSMPQENVEIEVIIKGKNEAEEIVLKRMVGKLDSDRRLSFFKIGEDNSYQYPTGKYCQLGSFQVVVAWWRYLTSMPQGL